MIRPAKDPAALQRIKDAAAAGSYVLSFHARQRMAERSITLAEIIGILMGGHREESKDQYSERMLAWTYALRGLTPETRELRIAVAVQSGVVVVTVIDLNGQGDHEN